MLLDFERRLAIISSERDSFQNTLVTQYYQLMNNNSSLDEQSQFVKDTFTKADELESKWLQKFDGAQKELSPLFVWSLKEANKQAKIDNALSVAYPWWCSKLIVLLLVLILYIMQTFCL